MQVTDVSNDCSDTLSKCNAECCRQFILHLPRNQNRKHLVIGADISFFKICVKDKIKYYKLHGCRYAHGVLSFMLNDFEVQGNKLLVKRDCDGLMQDLQCVFHDTHKQPVICRTPNKDEHENLKDVVITPNCKYRK